MKDVYYLYIYLGIIILMSLISFFLYSWDKRKAISGKWRTKEKTLLLSSFLFGAIGGIAGMYLKRHKTDKWYFKVVNFGSLLLQILGGALILYFFVIK